MKPNGEHQTRRLVWARDLALVREIMGQSFEQDLARRGTSIDEVVRPFVLALPLLRAASFVSPYIRHRMAGAVSLAEGVPVSVALMKPMGRDVSRWYIGPVATAPHARRQGHGRAALAAALSIAARNGASFCLLDVRVDNRAAIRLYESLGFRRYDGWQLLVADPPAACSLTPLPHGYHIRRLRAGDDTSRLTIARHETPQEVLAVDPPTPAEYRQGGVERIARQVEHAARRVQTRRWVVQSNEQPVAWSAARRSHAGQHSVAIHVSQDHETALTGPLLDRSLAFVRSRADLPVRSSIRTMSEGRRAPWTARGFHVIESSIRLGLRMAD